MIIISALLALSYQNYNAAVTQTLNAKNYYLALEAADAAAAALLSSSSSNGKTVLDKYHEDYKKLNEDGKKNFYIYGSSESMKHYTSDNKYLGESITKLVFEKDSQLNDDWAIVYIKTIIPDYRLDYKHQDYDTTATYEMYYELRIFVSNTNRRTFNIITEDKT